MWNKKADTYHQGTSHFTWNDGVKNTFHNLSAAFNLPGMDWMQNVNAMIDYKEICIYCHTPHGASSISNAPLWNRTINTGNYSPYNSPSMDSVPPDRSGSVSIACLSCHDGTIAIDSIINITGSGGHSQMRETVSRDGLKFEGNLPGDTFGCLSCHSINGLFPPELDFRIYKLGIDLTDDHPIGMAYANMPGNMKDPKFVQPDKSNSKAGQYKLWWFNEDGDNHADDDEIKLWGESATVECASCHNPHGTLRSDRSIIRPFLRKENTNSTLCLTCHIK